VIVLAQDEARALKHNYIGTEHILLGLIREEEGLAAQVLEDLNISIEEARVQVIRMVGVGEEVAMRVLPLTPRAKKVLELALREALSFGHNYIGTEHILLGIMRENEGVAARILADFDADSEKIRIEVIRLLSPAGRSRPEPSPANPAPSSMRICYRRNGQDVPAIPDDGAEVIIIARPGSRLGYKQEIVDGNVTALRITVKPQR
jgi:ATP-dependent Clp protease ATP-binding subunit ClpC